MTRRRTSHPRAAAPAAEACGHVRNLLPRYLEGALPEPDRAAVAQHLETCAGCLEEAGLDRELRSALVSLLTAPAPPPGFAAGVQAGLERRLREGEGSSPGVGSAPGADPGIGRDQGPFAPPPVRRERPERRPSSRFDLGTGRSARPPRTRRRRS